HTAEDFIAGWYSREAFGEQAANQEVVERMGIVALVDRDLPRLLLVHHGEIRLRATHGERCVPGYNRTIAVFRRHIIEEPEIRRTKGVRRDIDQHPPNRVASQA